MNRRKFFSALAGLPLVGALVAKAASTTKPTVIAAIDPAFGPDHTVIVTGEFHPMPHGFRVIGAKRLNRDGTFTELLA